MNGVRRRFTVPQRMLHWAMAVCILAMLFIGVGMVSTTAFSIRPRLCPAACPAGSASSPMPRMPSFTR